MKFARQVALLMVGTAATASAFAPVALAARGSAAAGVARRSLAVKATTEKLPVTCGEDVMSEKAHGTSEKPVQKDLRWGCDYDTGKSGPVNHEEYFELRTKYPPACCLLFIAFSLLLPAHRFSHCLLMTNKPS